MNDKKSINRTMNFKKLILGLAIILTFQVAITGFISMSDISFAADTSADIEAMDSISETINSSEKTIITYDKVENEFVNNIPPEDSKSYVDAETERTYSAVRFSAESLGAEVYWNGETEEVTLVRDDKILIMTIASDVMKITTVDEDGNNVTVDQIIDAVPIVKEGRTFLPIRFVAEGLGGTVVYEPSTGNVIILESGMTIGILDGEYYDLNGQEIADENYGNFAEYEENGIRFLEFKIDGENVEEEDIVEEPLVEEVVEKASLELDERTVIIVEKGEAFVNPGYTMYVESQRLPDINDPLDTTISGSTTYRVIGTDIYGNKTYQELVVVVTGGIDKDNELLAKVDPSGELYPYIDSIYDLSDDSIPTVSLDKIPEGTDEYLKKVKNSGTWSTDSGVWGLYNLMNFYGEQIPSSEGKSIQEAKDYLNENLKSVCELEGINDIIVVWVNDMVNNSVYDEDNNIMYLSTQMKEDFNAFELVAGLPAVELYGYESNGGNLTDAVNAVNLFVTNIYGADRSYVNPFKMKSDIRVYLNEFNESGVNVYPGLRSLKSEASTNKNDSIGLNIIKNKVLVK